MRLLMLLLMLLTTGVSGAGAWCWYVSASMKPVMLPAGSQKPPHAKDTDLIYELDDGRLMWTKVYDQSRYNTYAAILTAVSVLLQLVMGWLQWRASPF